MKKVLVFVIILINQVFFAQDSEIQLTIGNFFNAFHQRDSVALKKVCSENLVLHSISESEKGPKFSIQKASDFFKSIAAIPLSMKFEEKILSFKVQVDGSMAHVWTPYEFYVNDKLSHSGVNSFQLFKENDGWKVVYILDTRRK
ncbi:MAG: nuclear transport factor 2 family protein [Flavobacterium sp.]|jgi:hypothetical protein|uniref:nuclear transport factor 2 family protein n=1 Tax=Flavobacterium sp. TaxID=239 RepID=UPI003BA68931